MSLLSSSSGLVLHASWPWSRTVEAAAQSSSTSSLSRIALMLDVLIGTGAFALPAAVMRTGWLLFAVTAAAVCCLCALSSAYLLRAMHIAYQQQAEQQQQQQRQHSKREADGHEGTPLLPAAAASSSSSSSSSSAEIHLGFPYLMRHYCGSALFLLYELSVLSYLLCVLWALAAVFASQLAASVMALLQAEDCTVYAEQQSSSCRLLYLGCLAALAAATAVWSLLGAAGSQSVSNAAAVFRLVGFGLLTCTAAVALFYHGDAEDAPPAEEQSSALLSLPAIGRVQAVQASAEGALYSLLYSALSFHLAYDLSEVFNTKEWKWAEQRAEKRAALLTASSLLLSLTLDLATAVLCAAEFGRAALPVVNLQWRQWDGLTFSSSIRPLSVDGPLVKLVQVAVLLFPVVSALTSFPLLALSFCNSLTRLRHWVVQRKPLSAEDGSLAATAAAVVHSRWFTLLAVTPSLLIAAVRGRLNQIFFFTAPLSLLLQLVLPSAALLAVYRHRGAASREGEAQAEAEAEGWWGWLFRPLAVRLVLAAGCLLLLVTLALIAVVSL